MVISPPPSTLDEFLALPEQEPALEYLHGKVTQKVSPKGPHGALQYEIAERVNRFARPIKLARAFPETRVTFAGVSTVPNVVVYLWDRVPRDRRGEVAEDFLVPPDIAFEILSPGQTVAALTERCRWYVDNGVRIAVLVLPRDRSIVDFRPGLEPRVLRAADRLDLGDVLPGLSLTVKELFDSLSMD